MYPSDEGGRHAFEQDPLRYSCGNRDSAHHLMGGKTPSTFAEGIASGLGHPIIGPLRY